MLELAYQLGNQSFSVFWNVTNDVIAGVYTNENNVTYYRPMNFGRQRQIGTDCSYTSDLAKWLYANIYSGVYYNALNPSRLAFQGKASARFKLSKLWSADLTNKFDSKFQNHVVSVAPNTKWTWFCKEVCGRAKG